jgi:hypothetical protein
VSVINRAASEGKSISAQLDAAEQSVKRRFPEYFNGGGEQRLSDVRRSAPTPPAVQAGTRATTTTPREKGFAEIPSQDRQTFRATLLTKFMSRGMTQAQAEASYAASYWRHTPVHPDERGPEMWPTSPTSSSVWAKRRGVTR